jgi:hypothetical protein
MANNTNQKQQASDVPGKRSAVLEPLNALVGRWTIEFIHVELPDPIRGQNTFEWLEGNHFLIERSHAEHSEVPNMIGIIGVDESGDELAQHI